jgi:two-component system, OmpR family, KDP operon response regulator KdpE
MMMDSRCLLLLDDDPALRSLVAAVCDRHQWRLTIAEDRCDALFPAQGQRPKFLLLGFSLSDENALQLLCDLHAMHPQAPVGLITGDAPDDVADVVGLAGGTAVVVKPCALADVSAII